MAGRPREVQEWLAGRTPEQREQVDWLLDRVRAGAGDVSEAVKWGRLTLTRDGDWHHWLCAIAVGRRAVSLVFHKGTLLADPAGLLEGTGRYVRQVPYARAATSTGDVEALVRDALAHRTDLLDDPA